MNPRSKSVWIFPAACGAFVPTLMVMVSGFSVEKFAEYMKILVQRARKEEKPVIFINAWNEWGEGAFLEPDTRYQYRKLEVGDTVTMDQLFHALLIYSANDAAMAIARQVGGSVENFVQMMNDKAASLAMTGTHFANPHGLHNENHYTTAYDVYLMLYAAYQHTEFQNTMSMSSYTLNMTHADGTAGTIYLSSTDKYLTGEKNAPENVTVLGGKTGTTDEAGSCLALVSQNAYGEPFISVILHASTKVELYEDMNTLLSNINS